MEYTVKEVSKLTGTTVKTLHHYHKVGLLEPCKVTEAGYRIYGIKELERLQQILFYRELDFSLKDIIKALDDESNRVETLKRQFKLLSERSERMDGILKTIEESIIFAEKGENMDQSKMFKGLNKEQWKEVLAEQKEYLINEYEFEMDIESIDANALNEVAIESERFMSFLANALKNRWKPNDERLKNELERHIDFLNSHNMPTDSKELVETAWFFIEDDFHRDMLEGQQTGLSYYFYTVAEIHALKEQN
ncbi:MerR family transcriptional regulator [Alkaliphilus peptidifermentans]|uniref:DNA-binding transcriptional regulator, MerR family n=1 Tax=Alkaliphilus peptidifermentans DSM 18978 TaxID=1120976 RepID=A0A1G5E5L9_9FIRM|nr:MerR family transcriptional regulator [Alkaliphilus peptidifermentans]SCY22187.1 DNA-binding transcriptional regulator, MerR family [Alkaliphilus peptidifermentans DSM 18978]